jgi:hypothetical protein
MTKNAKFEERGSRRGFPNVKKEEWKSAGSSYEEDAVTLLVKEEEGRNSYFSSIKFPRFDNILGLLNFDVKFNRSIQKMDQLWHILVSILLHFIGISTGLWIWYLFPQNVS